MMYHEKYGDGNDKTIIFLHGMNFVQCFSKQISYFSKKYQVIVPHLPGFGKNSDVLFSADLAVQQVAELAASFKKPVILVGFSLGAQLCLPLMCRYKELWSGVFMISPWFLKDDAEVEKMLKQQSDNEKSMRSGIISMTLGLDKNERQEFKEFCKTVNMKSVFAAVDNGITLDKYPEYSKLKLNMMAVAGMKDPTDIRKSVRALVQQNPRCTYDMWDGAGHNIPYKFAPRLNKALDEFIGKLD